ncbi:hypothetical protein [Amycolatopsis benzoatilytica]|uniref:hypothetical protein n=1 Tax=Amycolatopsis benzoatilytica TaxID=346045 RepID=UPI00037F965E|nr:hypothetical protein [Amycolatopsis benzoatilytica]
MSARNPSIFPAAAAGFGRLTHEELLAADRDLLGEPGAAIPFADGSLPVYAVGQRLALKL